MFQKKSDYAPVRVQFTRYEKDGHFKHAVFMECLITGVTVGPIWGHENKSIMKAKTTLSRRCPCGKLHKIYETSGEILKNKNKEDGSEPPDNKEGNFC